jgi:hypothetical protein
MNHTAHDPLHKAFAIHGVLLLILLVILIQILLLPLVTQGSWAHYTKPSISSGSNPHPS